VQHCSSALRVTSLKAPVPTTGTSASTIFSFAIHVASRIVRISFAIRHIPRREAMRHKIVLTGLRRYCQY
jgi:hypothetical protein